MPAPSFEIQPIVAPPRIETRPLGNPEAPLVTANWQRTLEVVTGASENQFLTKLLDTDLRSHKNPYDANRDHFDKEERWKSLNDSDGKPLSKDQRELIIKNERERRRTLAHTIETLKLGGPSMVAAQNELNERVSAKGPNITPEEFTAIQTEIITKYTTPEGGLRIFDEKGKLGDKVVMGYFDAPKIIIEDLQRIVETPNHPRAGEARALLETYHYDENAKVLRSGKEQPKQESRNKSEISTSDLIDRAKLFLKGKLSDESGPFSEKPFTERPPEMIANHQKAFEEINGERGLLKRNITPTDKPESIITDINSHILEDDKKWKYNKDDPNDPTVKWVTGAITEAQAQAVHQARSFIETSLPQLNGQATSPDGNRHTAQLRFLLEQTGTEGKALLDEYNQTLQLNGQTRDQYVAQKVKEAKAADDPRAEKDIERAYGNAFDKSATFPEEKSESQVEKKLTLEQESAELNKAINLAMEFTDQFLIEGRRREPRVEVADMLTKLNLARANPDRIFRGSNSGEAGKTAYLLFQRAVVKEFNEKFLNNQFISQDQRSAMQAQLGDIAPTYNGERSVVPKETLQQDVVDLFESHLSLRGKSTEQIGQLLNEENYAETMSTIFSASLEGNNTKTVLGMSEITSGVASQWDKDDTQMLTQLAFGNLQQDEEWWRSSGELGQKYLKIDNNIVAMLNRFKDRWGGILAFCILFKLQEITSFDAAPAQQQYPV